MASECERIGWTAFCWREVVFKTVRLYIKELEQYYVAAVQQKN